MLWHMCFSFTISLVIKAVQAPRSARFFKDKTPTATLVLKHQVWLRHMGFPNGILTEIEEMSNDLMKIIIVLCFLDGVLLPCMWIGSAFIECVGRDAGGMHTL